MSLHEWDRSFIAIQIEKSYQNITTLNYFFPVNTMKKKKKRTVHLILRNNHSQFLSAQADI